MNEHRPLRIGDHIEIEFSPFLRVANPPGSRTNYYGTVLLYIVGTPGFQPWAIQGSFEDAKKNRGASLDSFPLPEMARSGGMTTSHQNYSEEPLGLFDQLATNMAPINAQPFVLGRHWPTPISPPASIPSPIIRSSRNKSADSAPLCRAQLHRL